MLLTLMLAILLCVGTVSSGKGTTPNIEQIFLGRCFEYQELSIGRLTSVTNENCTDIWTSFKNSWAFKEPRNITSKDYEDFLMIAKRQIYPVNKTLLWSGTYDIAHKYSNHGRRYITLEDSLIGCIVDGLTWCGKVCTNCDGINYDECPDWTSLPTAASEAFWGSMSEMFASAARGEVRVVVSGTDPKRPAYTRSSYFAKHELKSLPRSTILFVILANSVEKIPLESCGTGTLLDLQHAAEARGLRFVCKENPNDILHLMCVDNESSDKCDFQHKPAAGPHVIG